MSCQQHHRNIDNIASMFRSENSSEINCTDARSFQNMLFQTLFTPAVKYMMIGNIHCTAVRPMQNMNFAKTLIRYMC